MSTAVPSELGVVKSSVIEEIKSLSVSEGGNKMTKLFIKDENNSRQTNYVGWAIKTENLLRKRKCINLKNEVMQGKEDDALWNLIELISEELIEIIPKSKRTSFAMLWEYLQIKCQIGNRWDLEKEFSELKIDGVDILRFLERINLHIAKTERVITRQNQFDLLMKNADKIFFKDTKRQRRKVSESKW